MRRLVVVAFVGAWWPAGQGRPPAAPGPAPGPAHADSDGRAAVGTLDRPDFEGMGLITTDRTRNDYCTNYYDWSGTLSHQETRLTGTMTSRFAGADCVSGGRGVPYPGGRVSATRRSRTP